VQRALEVSAELEFGDFLANSLAEHRAEMHAMDMHVGHDFLVGRVPVDGVVALGVVVRGTHACKNGLLLFVLVWAFSRFFESKKKMKNGFLEMDF
jgi:hypothetical protein